MTTWSKSEGSDDWRDALDGWAEESKRHASRGSRILIG